MKQQDIDWIKKLDPEGMNGTIQSVLLSNDLSAAGFESVLKFLLIRTLDEKQSYIEEIKRRDMYLKSVGHYNSQALGLEE